MAVDMSRVAEASYTHPHLLNYHRAHRELTFLSYIHRASVRRGQLAKRYLYPFYSHSLPNYNYLWRGTQPGFQDTPSFAHLEKTAESPLPTLKSDAERESGPVGRTNL
jgi:hypothetical protein